jgi:hypothetical protein
MNSSLFFLIAGLMIAVVLGAWLASKHLEKSVYETFKKLGYKALYIIALFNIFDTDSDELHKDGKSNIKK